MTQPGDNTPGPRKPHLVVIDGGGGEDQDGAHELAEQLARRRAAALRLPPMECGCRDPDAWEHRGGRCRYAHRRPA